MVDFARYVLNDPIWSKVAIAFLAFSVWHFIVPHKKPNYKGYIHSPQWRQKLPHFHSFLCGQDCIFPWVKANHIHHLTYARLGREIFIIDVVPLHKITHAIVGIFDHAPFLIKFPIDMALRAVTLFWSIVFALFKIIKMICR